MKLSTIFQIDRPYPITLSVTNFLQKIDCKIRIFNI